MRCGREVLCLVASAALAAATCGCQFGMPPPAPEAGVVEDDPCAERLGDICEKLLLYYGAHDGLPQGLADLDRAASRPSVPLVCPRSGQPYVYDPNGLQVAGRPGRLIVYDATPCHSGMRWGIMAEPPRPGKPLIFRVIPVPERAILGSPPGPTSTPLPAAPP